MKTLMIKDLPVSEQLDSRAMSAVRGGTNGFVMPVFELSKTSLDFNTQQLSNQVQNTYNQNGVNAAFAGDIHSTVDPSQKASNKSNINIGGGYYPL